MQTHKRSNIIIIVVIIIIRNSVRLSVKKITHASEEHTQRVSQLCLLYCSDHCFP